MKRGCAVLCVLILVLLCGCSSGEKGREPENTVLAEVLGIDRMGGVWVLTAAGKDGKGEVVLQMAEGETLADAFAAMPAAGEKWISLTGVAQILLGDGVEPGEVLTFILKDGGMSWQAKVWYTPLAQAVMEETKDGGAARLAVLEQSGAGVVTVLDALAELTSEGEAELPVLTMRDGQMEIAGTLEYEVVEKG